jgi:UDP-N-acetylmuramyl tripeptide synthase
MGTVAVAGSDVAILTSDNPRDEDPLAIIEEALAGVPGGRENPRVVVEPDRRAAIRRALDAAEPGDVVVIAGKGHETYQEIAGRRLPFDDAVEAREALSARFASDPATWVAPASEQSAPVPAVGRLSASASRGTSAED